MSGNVSYAFTLLSKLPLHPAVFCSKNRNKIDFSNFFNLSLKGCFGKIIKISIFWRVSCDSWFSQKMALKSKKGETDKKGGEKITSFESLYIFLVSNFCTTWLSVCTNGENDVWSLQVASARQDEFVFTGCFLAWLVWHKLIWEKAITKKRMAIHMKETKIKTSSLSLTLEPGNKIFIRSTIFLLSEKTRAQNKRCEGFNNTLNFDDCNHEHPELSVLGK